MGITAEELAARAEAKRREVEQAKASEPTSQDTFGRSEPEVETCGCGQEYSRPLVLGRPFGPRLCPPCIAARNEPEAPAPSPPVDVLEQLADLGVNVRKHGGCTLDNWTADESFKPLTAAREFVAAALSARWSDAVEGLLLFGSTGTGKTHLATAIIRAALEGGMPAGRIVFDRADRLITTVQDTYGTGGTEAVLAKRERATLWVLDDLGREKATPDVLRILTDLFSAREAHPNVVTSNYNPDELAARFKADDGWARLSSRLGRQNFRAVKVLGRDRRFAA